MSSMKQIRLSKKNKLNLDDPLTQNLIKKLRQKKKPLNLKI